MTEADFDRAYRIDCMVYEGEEISDVEREFVANIIREIAADKDADIGHRLWAVFAATSGAYLSREVNS